MALPDPKTSPATAPGGTGSTNLLLWPLVIVIEDCFIPQSAPMIIEDVGKFDEFMCGLFIHLMVIKADHKLWDSRN